MTVNVAEPVNERSQAPCLERAWFIDHLWMLLCALVVVHHTAIAYGAMGGWCYRAPEPIRGVTQIALSTLLAVDQAFFMSLFFFISAYLLPDSFDRKGSRAFLKRRILRLGVPLLVYTLLVHPSLLYGIRIHTHSTTDSWLGFLWATLKQPPNTGHLWFVLALLAFECAYAAHRSFSRRSLSALVANCTLSHWHVAGFVLGCSVLAFALRQCFPIGEDILGVQLGYFGLYTAMYGLGIVARRNRWMDRLSLADALIWMFLALLVLPFVVNAIVSVEQAPARLRLYAGGLHVQAFLLTLWESITCVGLSGFLWVVFRKGLNTRTRISVYSSDTYAVYVIHPVVVVGATMLLEAVTLAPFVKFASVTLLSIAVCYALAHNLRKVPGIARVL